MQRITAKIIDQGPFTAKEAEVLCRICEGLFTTEIAEGLFRSSKTVAKHKENIAAKLNASGSTQIAVLARELGFVEITMSTSSIGNHIIKCMLLLLMCSNLIPQDGMRRPKTPRAPTVRVVRLTRQQ